MKLKTFFISYILFLAILLAAISTISIYFTNRQMGIIHEQSVMEYERIINTIEREINALYDRGQQHIIDQLLESHKAFHRQHNMRLHVEQIDEDDYSNIVDHSHILSTNTYIITIEFSPIDYHDIGTRYELFINGRLQTNYEYYETSIDFDVTDSILELRQIQRVLLILFIIFSLVAAAVLYIILNKIFKPLELVALSTEKIAKGDYSERIQIKGMNELALMANNFNQMAEEIEEHINHLEDESDRKQRFIDNLAHELRTPLTSIYGYAEYMQKAKLTEAEKLESTTFIMEESGHMRNITNSMLELAKLRDYEPKLEEIAIEELFNQMKSSLEPIFKSKKIEYVIEPVDSHIIGQSDLIKSMISNLCINAAKACAPDIGRVILKAIPTIHGVEITVLDNGCGIELQAISKLTEPFYQVDTARNKRVDGVGLGLAIVKQIVDIHKAELVIESAVGVGTKVKVIFTTS